MDVEIERSIPGNIRTHAAFMLIAWGICYPNATIAARHFRSEWTGLKFKKFKYWFAIHFILHVLLVALVIFGVMLMTVELIGYSSLEELPYSAHPIIGFITFGLVIINCFIAWFLITSTETRRSFFRHLHTCTGFIAHVLAVALIVLGFHLPKMRPRAQHIPLLTGMFLTSLIWYVITEVLLEVIGYRLMVMIRELKERYGRNSSSVEFVINRIAKQPWDKKQKATEFLIPADAEDEEMMTTLVTENDQLNVQSMFRKIHIFRAVKYAVFGIHALVSFSLTFVNVVVISEP